MNLQRGTRLGPFEVIAPLGAGGMGEVYRAKDTRLGRDVALKVLPDAFASDADRLARFRREAQVLASLSHSNIGGIYGVEEADGVRALVLELVEGPTLADRIALGAIPLDEALPIARQTAVALEAAHEHGIVHRDLKPSNIVLRPDGVVKVLDFGLAKALESKPSGDPSASATTTSPAMTGMGVILGTAAYMSPEQAKGKPVDKRTDIWAFGCVLFEMLTGRRAFDGDDVTDMVVATLTKEPDWGALPAVTPKRVVDLLRRCLKKDPSERLRDIGDARIEIEEARANSMTEDGEIPRTRTSWSSALLGTLVGIFAGGLVATTLVSKLGSDQPAEVRSSKAVSLDLPLTVELAAQDKQALALSPDGKHVVFPGRRGGVSQLYDRPFDRVEVSPIPGTEGATQPFFSPNGRWVGFTSGGKLKKVALEGGTPVALCDVHEANGATWGPDDAILFSGGGVFRVSASGGSPETITTPDPTLGETDMGFPEVLPGGQAILFTIWTGGYAHAKIALQSLKTGERKLLLDGTNARFARTGHIVYFRAGSLWAAPFDLARLEVTGEPVPVVQGIRVEWAVWPYFSIANDGTLLYVPGPPLDAKRLVWVDRTGAVQRLSAPARPYDHPRLSPDEQRLAIVIREEEHDVWTYELERGTLTRLTWDSGEDESPVWFSNGKRLFFAANRAGGSQLLSTGTDGSRSEEEVLRAGGGHRHVDSVSPDGQALAFHEYSQVTGTDLWVLPLSGNHDPQPFLRTAASETSAMFSPDGRWIAYRSDESGRSEAYVQAYPGPGERHQISTEGGGEPVWAQSGRELFYRDGAKMLVADIATQPAFAASRPRVLFEGRFDTGAWLANYDVSRDGQRFLMVEPAETTGKSEINVVLNWFEELKRLVPSPH